MLYTIGRGIYIPLLKWVFRYRVEGRENVPAHGGVLLVANHASLLDPPLLGNSVSRPVHFMAKGDLFKKPFLKWALPRVKAFPVHRGGADRAAVRRAIELLQSGEVVGLFPEGTRTKTGQLLPFQRGAGLIALRANVPVVPVALIGTFKPFSKKGLWPQRFIVKIGQPIDLSSIQSDYEEKVRGAAERVNKLMVEGIQALLKEET